MRENAELHMLFDLLIVIASPVVVSLLLHFEPDFFL
jgi:hypothetical protein